MPKNTYSLSYHSICCQLSCKFEYYLKTFFTGNKKKLIIFYLIGHTRVFQPYCITAFSLQQEAEPLHVHSNVQ